MKRPFRKVTFEGGADLRALRLARWGITSDEIASTTNLTIGQVNYRRHIAGKAYGFPRGKGFSWHWRHGRHPLLHRMMRDYAEIEAMEIQRSVTQVLVHPTPKISPHKVN